MKHCRLCGLPEKLSPRVKLVLVYAASLENGCYHLVPSEDYRVCLHDGCESVVRFIYRAIDAHPQTRGTEWTHAQIDFCSPYLKPWQIERHSEGVGLA